jgi:putative transferase (TIGR04331 family)
MGGIGRTLWLGNFPAQPNSARDIAFSIVTLANCEESLTAYAKQGLLAASQLDAANIAEAEAMAQLAYREVAIPAFSRLLKSYVNIELSPTELSILAGPWAMFLLHTCSITHRILERHIADFGKEPIVVMAPEVPPLTKPPANCSELVWLMISPEFQAWVATQFVELLKPSGWTISRYKLAAVERRKTANLVTTSWITKVGAMLKKLPLSGRCTSEEFSLSWRLLFAAMLSLRKTRFAVHEPEGSSRRSQLSDGNIPAPFATVLISLIETCTPAFLTLDFAGNVELVRKNHRFRPGFGRIVSSNIYNDYLNLVKALACAEGEVVFSVQHGGGYGTHKVFPLSPESEYLGGAFVTWGWKRHGNYAVNALDLPSPTLSHLVAVRRRTRHGKEIVFVGADMNPSVLRAHSKPNGVQWLDYREQKVDFLEALSEEVFGNVGYRGHEAVVLRDESFLLERYPTLRIIRGSYKNFHRRLIKAAVCVVDHPITTLHQALAMNLPTIAYWNPEYWVFSDDATPLFTELTRVGILHRSGREAGSFLEMNRQRLSIWWEGEEVQIARRRWCHAYARTSKWWAIDWMRGIWCGDMTGMQV